MRLSYAHIIMQETYSESYQRSKMECFAKIVNAKKLLANLKKLFVSSSPAGWNENSHKLPTGRNFFFTISLSKKIYMTKRFKKINSWYSKNVTLCMYLYSIFVWLCVIIMSHTCFRMNPHFIVCLNVKELLARSRCHILSLSDSNVIWTHNHLVHKRTLKHLAKLVKWWEKYLLKRSLIKHTCSWYDKLIIWWEKYLSKHSLIEHS